MQCQNSIKAAQLANCMLLLHAYIHAYSRLRLSAARAAQIKAS